MFHFVTNYPLQRTELIWIAFVFESKFLKTCLIANAFSEECQILTRKFAFRSIFTGAKDAAPK